MALTPAQKMKAMRERRRQKGLCICGQPRDGELKTCRPCIDIRSERQRSKKTAAFFLQNGDGGDGS
jgi:hypothetical protein